MDKKAFFLIFENKGYRILYANFKEDNTNKESEKERNIEFEYNEYISYSMNKIDMEDKSKDLAYEITEKIRNAESKLKCDCKKITVVAQDSNLIIKEIDILKDYKKKDIENIIEIEMEEFLNLNPEYYIKNYEKIDSEEDFLKVRVVLFPRFYVDIVEKIEKLKGCRCDGIYMNYQITQSILLGSINNFDRIFAAIEFREEDYILSVIENNRVKNSMVIDNKNVDESLIDYLNDGGKV
ncbi:hypothetical protein [Peptostreptococcus faecalis]|uniref:hypothetical protein n=1 Tax=Peptostreptococcus faecalis TaxID=2045015 RepID=UPI000C7E071E|nr:hypothetical protein [Peptostreptococcus faecalis]